MEILHYVQDDGTGGIDREKHSRYTARTYFYSQKTQMKVTSEKLPKSKIAITVELTDEEIKPHLERAATDIAKDLKAPGFRPGKMPYDLVAKKVGEAAIYQEAVHYIISKTYPDAVMQANVLVVGQPTIDVLKAAPGNPFIYKATVSLLPEIKLGDFTKIKARRGEAKVEPADLEKAIDQLRSMRASQNRVDRPAQPGDLVEVDFDLSVDKVKVDGGSSKNHPVTLGDGNFIPGFEDNLVGLAAGATKTFTLRFPADYHAKHLANREGSFSVKANGVFEIQKPELTEDFVKDLGHLGTVATFRQEIEKNLKTEQAERVDRKFEEELINELVSRTTFGEIPELLIDSEVDKMLHELKHDVTNRGMEWPKYLESIKKTEDGLRKEFAIQAAKRVKAALLIRQVAKEKNITVEHDEVHTELAEINKRYQSNPEVQKQIGSPAYHQYVENLLANRKVLEYLKQQAT